MSVGYNILHIEDNQSDAELIRIVTLRHLPRSSIFSVSNESDYRLALERGGFDIILSDFRIANGFDGDAAFDLARELHPETPFVLVTGELGEEFAIERLRKGVADFVLKDNLKRLCPVIVRAVEEAQIRRKLTMETMGMQRDATYFKAIFQYSNDAILLVDDTGNLTDVNAAAARLLGLTPEEMLMKNVHDLLVPTSVNSHNPHSWQTLLADGIQSADFCTIDKDGLIRTVESRTAANILPGTHLATLRDVTEQRRSETLLKKKEHQLKSSLEYVSEGCQAIGPDWHILHQNAAATKHWGFTDEEISKQSLPDLYSGREYSPLLALIRQCMEDCVPSRTEISHNRRDGSKRWLALRVRPGPDAVLLLSVDITEEKRMIEALRKHREAFEELVVEETQFPTLSVLPHARNDDHSTPILLDQLAIENDRLRGALEAIRNQRDHFEKLFNLVPDAYIVTDDFGKIVSANDTAALLFGQSKEQMTNTSIFQFVRIENQEALKTRLAQIAGDGILVKDERTVMVSNNTNGSATAIRIAHVAANGKTMSRLFWLLHHVDRQG